MAGIAPSSNVVPTNYTNQSISGTAYPVNIDGNGISGLRIAGRFAPRVQSTPNMSVAVDPGNYYWNGTETEVGAWTTGTFGNGGTSITVTGRTEGIAVGQQCYAYAYVSGLLVNYFPVGTIVTNVSGSTITVNQAATSASPASPGATIVFGTAFGGVISGTLNSSNVVTGLASTAPIAVGMTIFGTGIPNGLTVTSVDSSSQIHMSGSASINGTSALTFGIPAPSTNPRLDQISINRITGAITWTKGTENATPTAPALPSNNLPLFMLAPGTATTAITQTSIVVDNRDLTPWSMPQPTTQTLNGTGAGTYTTPTGCTRIEVEYVGGGGGGAGAPNTGTTFVAGSNGADTIFNGVHAGGGQGGGQTILVSGGNGGTSSTGTATVRLAGFVGGNGAAPTTQGNIPSGGGGGPGGGAGVWASGVTVAGNAGVSNTGGGGGGAYNPSGSNFCAAPGGGSGEYVKLTILNPAATYSYTVGDGGAGGSSGASGGKGGSGFIFVKEFYGA